jgi:hypothetical protein
VGAIQKLGPIANRLVSYPFFFNAKQAQLKRRATCARYRLITDHGGNTASITDGFTLPSVIGLGAFPGYLKPSVIGLRILPVTDYRR